MCVACPYLSVWPCLIWGLHVPVCGLPLSVRVALTRMGSARACVWHAPILIRGMHIIAIDSWHPCLYHLIDTWHPCLYHLIDALHLCLNHLIDAWHPCLNHLISWSPKAQVKRRPYLSFRVWEELRFPIVLGFTKFTWVSGFGSCSK